MYNSGIVSLWNYILYEKDRKNPTFEMQTSKKFFAENKKRVMHIEKILCDDKSKKIFVQCIKYRITHDYRVRPKYNRKNQYFPQDIVKLNSDEVFVDCGAYNGDTVQRFIKCTHGNYKRIVAFEPDASNVDVLKKRGKNIIVIQAACWSTDTELCFECEKGSSSRIILDDAQDNIIKVDAKAIDNIEECRDATFIKMDIEGSEYDALLGAYHTILNNTPKLAICIYHSDEDMLRIIELIESWNLGYKFFIRHHAQKTAETVLYAIK